MNLGAPASPLGPTATVELVQTGPNPASSPPLPFGGDPSGLLPPRAHQSLRATTQAASRASWLAAHTPQVHRRRRTKPALALLLTPPPSDESSQASDTTLESQPVSAPSSVQPLRPLSPLAQEEPPNKRRCHSGDATTSPPTAVPMPSKLSMQSRTIQRYMESLADPSDDASSDPLTASRSAGAPKTMTPTVPIFMVGTQVWAKFKRASPWWPARISYHPNTGLFQNKLSFHVQFYGPKPSHAWVLKTFVCLLNDVTVDDARKLIARKPSKLQNEFEEACKQAKSDNSGGGSLRSLASLELVNVSSGGDVVGSAGILTGSSLAGHENIRLLFNKGPACWLCADPGSQVRCQGSCGRLFHAECLGMQSVPKNGQFTCDRCSARVPTTCLHCTQAIHGTPSTSTDLEKCEFRGCNQVFHVDCALAYAAAQPGTSTFVCSLHRCTRCMKTIPHAKSIVRCIRCPTIFHKACVPAGSQELDSQHIICARHLERKVAKNVEYCVACGDEGDLICCDGCTAAMHLRCLKLESAPEGKWLCMDCLTKPFPAIGDVAMVKFSHYRTWPVRLLPPEDQPDFMQTRAHKPSDVVVDFLGAGQFAWVEVATVMPFNEHLLIRPRINPTSTLEKQYSAGLIEAKKLQQEMIVHGDNVATMPVFSKIIRNAYVPPCRPLREAMDPDSLKCFCARMNTHCDSNCLNRLSMIECSKDQCTDPLCQNKRMQHRSYAKLELFHTGNKGWGLRTLGPLKKGDLVIEYVGEAIDLKTCAERLKQYQQRGVQHYYFLTLDKGVVLDASIRGNIARFMNHSCDANCETQTWIVNGYRRIGIFAKTSIQPGDELCFNYQYEALVDKRQPCFCGTATCSGFIGARKTSSSTTPTKGKQPTRRRKRNKSSLSEDKKSPSPAAKVLSTVPSRRRTSRLASVQAAKTLLVPRKLSRPLKIQTKTISLSRARGRTDPKIILDHITPIPTATASEPEQLSSTLNRTGSTNKGSRASIPRSAKKTAAR